MPLPTKSFKVTLADEQIGDLHALMRERGCLSASELVRQLISHYRTLKIPADRTVIRVAIPNRAHALLSKNGVDMVEVCQDALKHRYDLEKA